MCVCYTVTIHHISRLTCVSSGMVDFSVHIYLSRFMAAEGMQYLYGKQNGITTWQRWWEWWDTWAVGRPDEVSIVERVAGNRKTVGDKTFWGEWRDTQLQVLSRPSNSLLLLFDKLQCCFVTGPCLQHLQDGVLCRKERNILVEIHGKKAFTLYKACYLTCKELKVATAALSDDGCFIRWQSEKFITALQFLW